MPKVEDLSVNYGLLKVLKKVSLTLREKEIFTL